MNSLNEDDQFEVVAKYFSEYGPVQNQFDSYEFLVHTMLQKLIDEIPAIYLANDTSKYCAKFGQIYVESASMVDRSIVKKIYPNEARLRNLTYESNVSVDVIETHWHLEAESGTFVQTSEVKNGRVFMFKLPVMVGSSTCNLFSHSAEERVQLGECSNDPGGYFIINGQERALIFQERQNYNSSYVFACSGKYEYTCDIRSISDETGHSVSLQAKWNERETLFMIPFISKYIHAGILFKALGCTPIEIFNFIRPPMNDNLVDLDGNKVERNRVLYFVDTIIQKSIGFSSENALNHIASFCQKSEEKPDKKRLYTLQILENELFPHMGTSTTAEKCVILGSMIRKLLLVVLRVRREDNKDNLSLKRIEGPSILIADLLRMSFKRHVDTLKSYLEKRKDITVALASRSISLTTSLRSPFLSGKWSIQKNSYVRTGVSQIINKLSFPATVSHLRRIMIPIGKEGSNIKIRQIDPSQIFFVDLIESPEGKSIGIVKNLSLLANVTTGCNSVLIQNLVAKSSFLLSPSVLNESVDYYCVYVNSILQGVTEFPAKLYQELDEFRVNRYFSNQVSYSISEIDKEIRILCDAGRYIRPVFVVNSSNQLAITKEQVKALSFSEMVEQNLIRYIDSNEAENAVIAMTLNDLETKKCNYAEIHPSVMLGVCSAVIPFSEHNQCPRLIYQASMVKQALGMYSLAYRQRFDTTAHVLNYLQKPLAETRYDKILKFDEMLSGINPIVAIAAYGGANQEDSIIMNKSSVDRGMFVHLCYKTIETEENKKSDNIFECIKVPSKLSRVNGYDYSKLQSNGIIKVGTPVVKGDVVVGKVSQKAQREEDCSLIVVLAEEGIIDEVWEGLNEIGNRSVKIRIRQLRIPEVGDKFASRSSQKGVIGSLLSQENMPYTMQGIVPDLIINPLCMPSRMTLSQLLECLSSKVSTLTGKIGDATTFSQSSIDPLERISTQLKEYGFSPYGKERMYNGYTGELMDASIFIGPTYYQRLRHLVKDKIHCLDLSHDVLTENGWKNISLLTMQDKIATLDSENYLVYQHPEALLDYPDYEGLMYEIKTNNTDLHVTGNHRMWVQLWDQYELIEARSIFKKKVFYQHNCNALRASRYKLPFLSSVASVRKELNYEILLFSFLEMVAIFYDYGEVTKENSVSFTLNGDEKLRAKLVYFFQLFGFSFTIVSNYEVSSRDKGFLELVRVGGLCDAFQGWLLKLDSNESYVFLLNLFEDGDYFVSSRERADCLQQLCLHAGISCAVVKNNKGYVLLKKKYVESYDEIYLETLQLKACHVKCVTVPNGIFYVRRNGKACFTGNSRARGNITMMYSQPADGRSVDGGLRLGEMEKDTLLAHGGSVFLKEGFFDMSDAYSVEVCEECGNIISNEKNCKICKSSKVHRVDLPYCAKLLFQELQSMNIKIQINTKE